MAVATAGRGRVAARAVRRADLGCRLRTRSADRGVGGTRVDRPRGGHLGGGGAAGPGPRRAGDPARGVRAAARRGPLAACVAGRRKRWYRGKSGAPAGPHPGAAAARRERAGGGRTAGLRAAARPGPGQRLGIRVVRLGLVGGGRHRADRPPRGTGHPVGPHLRRPLVRRAGSTMKQRADKANPTGKWVAAIERRIPRESGFRGAAHDERVTARIGLWLAIAFGICFLTGLLSHAIQHPPAWFWWPSRPAALYQVTQGLHVISGVAAIPLLLAKLWTVYPKLFGRPVVRSVPHALERGSILVLSGAAFFELGTGLFNSVQNYVWGFYFPTAHYAVAWVAVGSILIHIAVKLPVIRRGLRRLDPEP